MGITTSIETFVLFKNDIISMIIGTVPAAVTGPVGIAQITGEVARIGIGASVISLWQAGMADTTRAPVFITFGEGDEILEQELKEVEEI